MLRKQGWQLLLQQVCKARMMNSHSIQMENKMTKLMIEYSLYEKKERIGINSFFNKLLFKLKFIYPTLEHF
jgi:hypothetical protein